VNATYKRPDGIVAINYDDCIGCRYCLVACPYSARTFDAGRQYLDGTPNTPATVLGQSKTVVYEKSPAFEYSVAWERKEGESPVGNARKCQFCSHRLNAGMLPACTTTCIGRATYFGDANDPDALVSQLVASPNVMRLKEEMGTEPKVYYLV
jgi:molybdopterin-containing oxidoreductase family iron-sulfur binding subunit